MFSFKFGLKLDKPGEPGGATLAPEVQGERGATYDTALPWASWSETADLNYQYQSKVNFDLFQDPLDVNQPDAGGTSA